jgi:hypothetical protein
MLINQSSDERVTHGVVTERPHVISLLTIPILTSHQQFVNLVSSFHWFFGVFGFLETRKPETWKP